jgi:hypothetical protein
MILSLDVLRKFSNFRLERAWKFPNSSKVRYIFCEYIESPVHQHGSDTIRNESHVSFPGKLEEYTLLGLILLKQKI